jgi:hypothetical protein
MAPYLEDFPVGSKVRIADAQFLLDFKIAWRYHNKLEEAQVAYAGQIYQVSEVSFYHGGDVLYRLVGVPGLWHESCLNSATP